MIILAKCLLATRWRQRWRRNIEIVWIPWFERCSLRTCTKHHDLRQSRIPNLQFSATESVCCLSLHPSTCGVCFTRQKHKQTKAANRATSENIGGISFFSFLERCGCSKETLLSSDGVAHEINTIVPSAAVTLLHTFARCARTSHSLSETIKHASARRFKHYSCLPLKNIRSRSVRS